MLNFISNKIYDSTVANAIKYAFKLVESNQNWISACEDFFKHGYRLKPFIGSRPIMEKTETVIIMCVLKLKSAGFDNARYAMPDDLRSAYNEVREVLTLNAEELSLAYMHVKGELPFRVSIKESSSQDNPNNILIADIVENSVERRTKSGRIYYQLQDGTVYYRTSKGWTLFNDLYSLKEYIGE